MMVVMCMASYIVGEVGDAKLSVSMNGLQIRECLFNITVAKRKYQGIGKPSKIVSNDGSMGSLHGIAFGKDGIWAVADDSNSCVHIFNSQDELVRKVGSWGSSEGEFDMVLGVAFDSDNKLYIVDCNNLRV